MSDSKDQTISGFAIIWAAKKNGFKNGTASQADLDEAELALMNAVESTYEPKVVCKLCDLDFVPCFEGSKSQGAGCASSCGQAEDLTWIVEGHYGSFLFDCNVFVFASGQPPDDIWKDADPICDGCVKNAVDQGILVPLD